ncbi:hypothetical protein [Paenibacillus rhizophilus]|uniref:DUF551 domain-containing protein n=1 Tax=Paenibacillus rhizophilus TaxID=1850366 RepID=A0A3N9P8M9_9BACL|nr:hypothetical protein [Paenibacillus rhizophilus]RQW11830.1 hypothetical protein EH198_09125 [Paenibacillus rhizophilus]
MISWIKYDPENPPEPEIDYLIFGREPGKDLDFCFVGTFKFINFHGKKYPMWEDNMVYGSWNGVTKYAPINLPGEDTSNG